MRIYLIIMLNTVRVIMTGGVAKGGQTFFRQHNLRTEKIWS